MTGAIRRREDAPPSKAGYEAQQLIALIHECVISGIARHACVVHLSRLSADRARPHHLRLASAALEPLAQADRARLFILPNLDLVVVWRGIAETALAASRDAVEHLFADKDNGPVASLWEELDLPGGAERLLAIAEQRDASRPVSRPAPVAPPLDPATLALLESGLANADVARFVRRRQVCAVQPDGAFRLKWETRKLAIDELVDSLIPGHAPQADPWLFRRLTRTLDSRMLALLAASGELAGAGPFSINLNISSILAPGFLRFDTALPMGLRGHVTLGLLAADVLSDPAAFLFARDFASSRVYRLLLHGVTADLLPMFPVDRIGVDFLQLRWSDALLAIGGGAIEDPSRIILSHADTHQAINWGRLQGIALFQGHMAVASSGG